MPQHLLLPDPRRLPSRRAGGGGGGTPPRQPGQHGRHLRQQLATAISAPRRLDLGVDPTLVFKVKAGSRPEDSAFQGRGLQVLGETVDYTYFVLADDQGSAFSAAIERYVRTGDMRSFFNMVEDIETYGPDDRRGPGLDTVATAFNGTRVFDVSIWPASTLRDAQSRVETITRILLRTGGRIVLRSVSARRTYLRVEVSLEGLDDLLEASVIEVIRVPPVPFIDFREWRNLSIDEIRREDEPGAVVGVLDDAPAVGHPLLDGLVLSVESLSPANYKWQQLGSHGTEVVGRVLYPNLHSQLRDLEPVVPVGAVRVVRILEPDPAAPDGSPRFATYGLPHDLVEQAIRHLHREHGVKVFNLSIGYSEPFNEIHVGPLTEAIDDLVRELGIVVVVPTGNAPIDLNARTASGHHIIDDKPQFFFTPEQRLSEPAPAALAVTVGSVALSGAPAELPNRVGWRAAAEPNEASPFTRGGPGLGTTQRRVNKPEFTHYGGNVVVNDTGNAIRNDPGASIVSTSSRLGDGRLFASVNGTSFAAPAVARIAADIAYEYPEASANLIRALLVTSAAHSAPAATLTEPYQRLRVYGYGKPTRHQAVTSGPNRATMTFDGVMPIDTVQIHPFPVPEVFRRGSGGERSIAVALAFDPPVRRQRREYVAASMKVDIYRDIDPDELADILIKQDPDDPNDMISDRRRLTLGPGSNSFTTSTLHLRRWRARNSFINDDDTFYVVVTHKAQTWARNEPGYLEQSYALAVTLKDESLVEADLHQLLTQQVHLPARIRIRA